MAEHGCDSKDAAAEVLEQLDRELARNPYPFATERQLSSEARDRLEEMANGLTRRVRKRRRRS